MNNRDPRIIALLFNECINNQDIQELSNLMTEDHKFIDRQNEVTTPKEQTVKGWIEFFKNFLEYQNYFPQVESKGDTVIIPGYAIWANGEEKDHAIWVAKIQDDCVSEWRIYNDTTDVRKKFNII
jgi:ketosteroid isomerase-like protein